tara:strand:+ start:227 stop:403 length:177 start_codon:yes stop_codon:yes gene_type:complete
MVCKTVIPRFESGHRLLNKQISKNYFSVIILEPWVMATKTLIEHESKALHKSWIKRLA